MYLYIDTTEKDSFAVAWLSKDKVLKKKAVKSERKHSEKLLKSIAQMLNSVQAALKDIEAIVVVKGPGAFTSLRIGVSVANALAYGLKIPALGIRESERPYGRESVSRIAKKLDNQINKKKPKIQVVKPEYGRPPHITPKKKKEAVIG